MATVMSWRDPQGVLEIVDRVLAPGDVTALHVEMSAALQDVIAHEALAVLAGRCARSPMSVVGDEGVAGRVVSADLAHLAATVAVGEPWAGRVPFGGEDRDVVAFASAAGGVGSLLVLAGVEPAAVAAPQRAFVARLWDVLAGQIDRRVDEALPVDLSASRQAAAERTRVAAELTDAHGAVLSALLGTLRARALDDRAARRAATDLAASALVELRTTADRESGHAEEDAGEAFGRLREQLGPLVRYSSAQLEFAAPGTSAPLPGVVAQAARAIVRGAVLTMLEQEGVTRVRVEWRLEDGGLRVGVRDDGPGGLGPQALAVHELAERARALDGALDVESPLGWGTRVLARLPLALGAGEAAVGDPLAALAPRELDVLAQLARGRRNRQIAAELDISENTVKFHVANVLAKLAVSSRGEAAVVARDAGLGASPLAAVG